MTQPVNLPSNEFWGKRFGYSRNGENRMDLPRGSNNGGINNSRPVGKRNTRWYGPTTIAMQDTYKRKKA